MRRSKRTQPDGLICLASLLLVWYVFLYYVYVNNLARGRNNQILDFFLSSSFQQELIVEHQCTPRPNIGCKLYYNGVPGEPKSMCLFYSKMTSYFLITSYFYIELRAKTI